MVGDFSWGRDHADRPAGRAQRVPQLRRGAAGPDDAGRDRPRRLQLQAPILRWSGHSQETDPLAAEVGAFFARLKVPIDFVPGAEALIAKAAPPALYCAFIQFVRERLSKARSLRDANRWLADWGSREGQRMEAAAAEHWKAATELRRQLGAMEATARE